MREEVKVLAAFLVILGLISVILTPSYTGRIVQIDNLDDVLNNQEQLKDEYNQIADSLPGAVKSIIANELINLTITRNDGSIVQVGIKTVDGKIIQIGDINESYTLNVYMTEATFDNILSADDQITAIEEALSNDEIEYDAVKITTKAKLTIAKAILWVRGLFT